MKNIIVIGGFAINYKPLNFLDTLGNVKYIDINQFPSTYNIEDMSRTIRNSLKSDKNILIAYSMGGLLAIDLVYKYPGIFKQVILLYSTPYFIEDANWLGISRQSFKKLQTKLDNLSIDEFFKYFMTLIAHPDKLPEYYKLFQSTTTKAQLNNLLNILLMTDFRDKSLAIKEKITSINATNDVLVKNNSFVGVHYFLDNCTHLDISKAQNLISKIVNSLPPNKTYSKIQSTNKPISSTTVDHLIQYNFNKASSTYTKNKNIQILSAGKIESYLLNNSLHKNLILDLGSGPGTFKNITQTILYDLSLNMLKSSYHDVAPTETKTHKLVEKNNLLLEKKCYSKVNGNATNLPFVNNAFPIIASNLMLQWPSNKTTIFKEAYRTLQKKGLFIYTTLIDGSLWQLKDAFKKIDNKSHTLSFITADEYLELAHINNFQVMHTHIWEETLLFNDINNLLLHFKLTGTTLPKSNCNSGLGGRKTIQQLENTYIQNNLQYSLTYKMLFMVLQK